MTQYYKRITGSVIQGTASAVTEPLGTIVVTNDGELRLHDGSTAGGVALGGGSTANTSFAGDGIGNNAGNNMTISPNWDGQFTGNSYLIIPTNDNAIGTALQLVNNTDGGVEVITKNNATWIFDKDGVLTIPGAIANTTGIEMSTARGTVQFGYDLEAPGLPTHFHINKVDQSFDLFFGDDANYFHLPATGGAPIIGANDGSGGQKLWQFGQDGALTFPDYSQQSFAPSMGTGPLTGWGIGVPNSGGIAGTDYQCYFDPTTGYPSILSYSLEGGNPLYNTIWTFEGNLAGTPVHGNSGSTPQQVTNTVPLTPVGATALVPGDYLVVRLQNLNTGRIYRATFLGSYNAADEGNETHYGSITVERLF